MRVGPLAETSAGHVPPTVRRGRTLRHGNVVLVTRPTRTAPGTRTAARTAHSSAGGAAVPEGVLAASQAHERARQRRRRWRVGWGVLVALVLAVGVNQAARVAADAVGPQGGSTAGDRTHGDGTSGGEHAATGLDPELERRFAAAQDAAAADGVTLVLNSGWRSADEQRRIVRDAVDKYGSEREAHRWVLPARHSAHVQGLAVDVGPPEGAQWLSEHGEALGLCRTYENEPWHFEPLPAGADTCPPRHPDSSWGWS